jgi:superfamily I DNA/RNA helicase
MKLPEISTEQNRIIQELLLNNNVVIDSVAGSGKTTCNLHIASYFKNLKILLMTYNSKLKIETREKIQKLKLENIEVHSYHSFCVKYYTFGHLKCRFNSK